MSTLRTELARVPLARPGSDRLRWPPAIGAHRRCGIGYSFKDGDAAIDDPTDLAGRCLNYRSPAGGRRLAYGQTSIQQADYEGSYFHYGHSLLIIEVSNWADSLKVLEILMDSSRWIPDLTTIIADGGCPAHRGGNK